MSALVARRSACDYASLASVVLAYAVLGPVWWACGRYFWRTMASRLTHSGPGTLGFYVWHDDFSVFWPTGVLARTKRAALAYDPVSLEACWHQLLPQAPGVASWFYLPPALLPVMAVSYLPFELGYWAWITGQILLAVTLLRWARLSWAVIVVGLLSPAALWSVQSGQFGLIMGALTVTALMCAERAPVAAGLVLGCLVIKPQSGILAGVAMLGRRRYWRLFGAAAAMGLALSGLVTVLAGWRIWPAYWRGGLTVSTALLQTPSAHGGLYETFGVSVFWAVRELGWGLRVAYGAQLASAVVSALLVWRLWRVGWGQVTERMAVTVCLSLLATPFGYTYDMVAYELALAAYAQARGWRIDALDALLFVAPAICPLICFYTGWLLTPVAAAVAGARIFWRRQGNRYTAG